MTSFIIKLLRGAENANKDSQSLDCKLPEFLCGASFGSLSLGKSLKRMVYSDRLICLASPTDDSLSFQESFTAFQIYYKGIKYPQQDFRIKAVAAKAIEVRADYVLPVKENHPGLLEDIRLFFDEASKRLLAAIDPVYCEEILKNLF